jgi:hypothetical protein
MLRREPERMNRGPDPSSERRRAITLRDVAKRRLRRTTQLSIAATIVIGGVFASLAAGSTHFTKRVVRQTHRSVSKTVVQAQAPAPPLVNVQSPAPPPAPSPAPTAPPTVTPQPPVVVSGGS